MADHPFATPRLVGQEIKPIEIVLGQTTSENSFIELIQAEKGKPDKVSLLERGLKLEQLSGGKNAKPCGFRFKQGSQQFFSLLFDLEILQLPAPKIKGTGHGFFVRLVGQNANDVFSIGCGVNMRNEKGFFSFAGLDPKPNEIVFVPFDYSKGTWLLQREVSEIHLLVSEEMPSQGMPISFQDVKRFPCPIAAVKEFQFVGLRQDSSKPACEYVVKRLQFASDEYYTQPQPSPPWPWGTIAFWSFIVISVPTAAWQLIRLAKRKEWLT